MPVFIIREQGQQGEWRTESLSGVTTRAGALQIATDRFNRGGISRLELYRKLRYHQDLGHPIACLAVLDTEDQDADSA